MSFQALRKISKIKLYHHSFLWQAWINTTLPITQFYFFKLCTWYWILQGFPVLWHYILGPYQVFFVFHNIRKILFTYSIQSFALEGPIYISLVVCFWGWQAIVRKYKRAVFLLCSSKLLLVFADSRFSSLV